MVALRKSATHFPQAGQLCPVFNSFRDNTHLQTLGESQDGPDNLDSVLLRVHQMHERAVDLQCVEGQAVKVTERGISGSKIVDLQPNPQALENQQRLNSGLRILHQNAFGHLQVKTLRGKARYLECLLYIPKEILAGELLTGKVDAYAEVR